MVFKQRSEAAFESLYSRHARDVYGYALAMLGDPADAEDVTQTTFMNAYRAFERGQRPSKPRGWLFAIAHNVCRQRWRQAASRPREVELEDRYPAADESEAPSAQEIARALQALPFNQRSALVMRELEGRRQSEIAEALGVSVSAVETLLFRARRGVREQLESSLTCDEAARAISRQLDGGSSRADRAALRAHLRRCDACATFARRARAHQGALRRMRALPLPASLLAWGGGTAAAPAGGLAAKLLLGAAVVAIAAGPGDAPVRRARAVAPVVAAQPVAKHAVAVHPPAVATPVVTTARTEAPHAVATVAHGVTKVKHRAPGKAKAKAKARGRVHGRALGLAKPAHVKRIRPAKPAKPAKPAVPPTARGRKPAAPPGRVKHSKR